MLIFSKVIVNACSWSNFTQAGKLLAFLRCLQASSGTWGCSTLSHLSAHGLRPGAGYAVSLECGNDQKPVTASCCCPWAV